MTTSTLKRYQRNGRAHRGGYTWAEARDSYIATFGKSLGRGGKRVPSKTKMGQCQNIGCVEPRQNGSSRCGKCSLAHRNGTM